MRNLTLRQSVKIIITAAVLASAEYIGAAPAQAHYSLVSGPPTEGKTIIEVVAGNEQSPNAGRVTIDGATMLTEVGLKQADEYTMDRGTQRLERAYTLNTLTYRFENEAANFEPYSATPASESMSSLMSLMIGILGIVLAPLLTYFIVHRRKKRTTRKRFTRS